MEKKIGEHSTVVVDDAARLIEGMTLGDAVDRWPIPHIGSPEPKTILYCSFCGKSQHEVRKLVAGPTVFICNKCVDLCKKICDESGD